MALTLTVDRAAWIAHITRVAEDFPGLVPVVKGNGYGFGRARLTEMAVQHLGATEVAVGTVYELAGLPVGVRRLVLTPPLPAEVALAGTGVVLTTTSTVHLASLAEAGWRGPVVVKLESSMRRYGVAPHDLAAVLEGIERAGMVLHGVAIHPPLAGSQADHAADAETWLSQVPVGVPVYVSHLDVASYGRLLDTYDEVHWLVRQGTALWLGDKSFLHLGADVAEVRPAAAGQTAGYRSVPVPGNGHLVMVTAGTAHGVHPLPDGRSPFHFARRRLALLEPPHMHTSMCFVPQGEPCPAVGEVVDVQRPLTQTWVDRVVEQ